MSKEAKIFLGNPFLVMVNTCARHEGNRGGSCISGVSVLQKVAFNYYSKPNLTF